MPPRTTSAVPTMSSMAVAAWAYEAASLEAASFDAASLEWRRIRPCRSSGSSNIADQSVLRPGLRAFSTVPTTLASTSRSARTARRASSRLVSNARTTSTVPSTRFERIAASVTGTTGGAVDDHAVIATLELCEQLAETFAMQ